MAAVLRLWALAGPDAFLTDQDYGGRLREGTARRADKTEQGHGKHADQTSGKNPLPDPR